MPAVAERNPSETIYNTKVLAYDPEFDRRVYRQALETQQYTSLASLDIYTKRQVETHIGERLNVLLSKTRYEIKNGEIYGENTNEPFLNMLKRGRDYRKKYGKNVDWAREEAEVEGFTKIQKALCKEEKPLGTMFLSFSLPGGRESSYQHNFYDIFTLEEDVRGRYIEARRYSSSLNLQEANEKAHMLGPSDKMSEEDFLRNPFEIKNDNIFSNAGRLHDFLYGKHDFLNYEDFQEVLNVARPAILNYIEKLKDGPFDNIRHNIALNAVLNIADKAAENIQKRKKGAPFLPSSQNTEFTDFDMQKYGLMPVRKVMTGCGASGGFSTGANTGESTFSVSDFASKKDKYGSLEFDCPDCKRKNTRPRNTLLKECQHCGSNKIGC